MYSKEDHKYVIITLDLKLFATVCYLIQRRSGPSSPVTKSMICPSGPQVHLWPCGHNEEYGFCVAF